MKAAKHSANFFWLLLVIVSIIFGLIDSNMPNKYNDKYRHKFKKSTCKVKNWAKYNDALRDTGDITIWFTEEAIQSWVPARNSMKGRPQK